MKKIWVLAVAIITFYSCTEPVSEKEENKSFEEVVVNAEELQSNQNPVLDSLNLYLINQPNSVEALNARFKEYVKQKNLRYALADAEAAYYLDSLNPDVLMNWGEIHYFFNKTRVSRDAWQTCAKLDPQNIDCRLKLAELYHVVSEFEKSLKMAREVIAIDGQNATAYLIIGLDYRDGIFDTVSALKNIQKAIDLKQDYFDAIEHAALLYTYMKNPLADAYFVRLIELQPNNYLVHYNRGLYFYKVEEWNRALESLTHAQQLNPTDPEVYMTLGMVHLKIKANMEAKELFTQAIKYSPSGANYRAYYGRGYAYEMMGDIGNARKDYIQARSFNPTHEPTKIALERIARQDAQIQSQNK